MTTIDPSLDRSVDACATDTSCADSGCGCTTPTESDERPAKTRRGLKAGFLAAACAAACLAGPLALGGAAVTAWSGAIAGGWWLLVGVTLAAIVVGVVMARRRRTGKLC